MQVDAGPDGDVIDDAIATALRRALDGVNLGGDGARTSIDVEDDVIDLRDEDPYVVFGLETTASWEQIAARRRELIRRWHPDAGGSEDRLRRINAAYAELRIRRER